MKGEVEGLEPVEKGFLSGLVYANGEEGWAAGHPRQAELHGLAPAPRRALGPPPSGQVTGAPGSTVTTGAFSPCHPGWALRREGAQRGAGNGPLPAAVSAWLLPG